MIRSKTLCLTTCLIFGLLPAAGRADDKPDTKKICKEAREQLKTIEKELTELEAKRTQIQGEIDQTKSQYFAEQGKLRGMPRCSSGNPNNPPACEAQLSKVKELGDQLTQLQNSLNPLTPRRVELENSIYKPRNDLIQNKCEGS
jgi:chromosome segregation ATPase